MTAGELMEYLSSVPANSVVILQADAEGNGYSPLAGADEAFYEAESTWSGQVIDRDYLEGYDEEDIQDRLDHATPCIVFWPVN